MKFVKTGKDGLKYYLANCNGQWHAHIATILRLGLCDLNNLSEAGLSPAESILNMQDHEADAAVMLEFTMRLCGNRSFSHVGLDCPPFCYAGVFSGKVADKIDAMVRMQSHWDVIVKLENAAHTSVAIRSVLEAMTDVLPPCVRLLFLAFESDGWDPASVAGRRVLSNMLGGIPDTKGVEDTHQHLRDLQRKGRSLVSSKLSRMSACVDSGVLEERNIKHGKISKAEFVSSFRTRVPKMDGRFKSRKHKLSQAWSEIMDPRKGWVSQTPEASRGAYAAWNWVLEWYPPICSSHTRPVFLFNRCTRCNATQRVGLFQVV